MHFRIKKKPERHPTRQRIVICLHQSKTKPRTFAPPSCNNKLHLYQNSIDFLYQRREGRRLTHWFSFQKKEPASVRKKKISKGRIQSGFLCLSHIWILTFGEILRWHHRKQLILICVRFWLIVKRKQSFDNINLKCELKNLLCHGFNNHFNTK